MTDYQKYINALRKCAEEHDNKITSLGHIIVSDLCRDTADLLARDASEIDKLDTYKMAFRVAVQLLNGDVIYGIDDDRLFIKIMEIEGGACSLDYEKFILENLDRFSDDDKKREEAIKRLGW